LKAAMAEMDALRMRASQWEDDLRRFGLLGTKRGGKSSRSIRRKAACIKAVLTEVAEEEMHDAIVSRRRD
jgi:hypothetical protein